MQIESMALVIHHLETGINGNSMAIVAHEFRQSESGPQLGPGRVFNSSDKRAMAKILVDEINTDIELLSECCLVSNLETLTWYRPRAKASICMHGKDLNVPLPNLVFLCHKGKLFVKAFKGTKRPNFDTDLFSSSLPNMYEQGSWCSGGNRLPEHPTQRDIAKIETMFFESPFTHSGSEPFPGTTIDTWLETLQEKQSFPIKALIPSRLTLGTWINRITRGF